MPALKRIDGTRIVARPAALDAATWPAGALVLRFAPDEVLVDRPLPAALIDDPHAIVTPDAGFAGIWLPADKARALLEAHCAWPLPAERPAFAQGAVAGLAVKLWLEAERILFVVPGPFIEEFEERLL